MVGFPLLTIVLTSQRTTDSLATALSCYLVLVVLVAVTGGVWPAVLAAVAGFLLSNYYAPPIHTFTIADARDVLALAMFLITAGAVSVLVDLATRRTAAAIQSRADATMLARVAGRMVAPEGTPLGGLLDELMVAFRLDAASVLRKDAGRPTGGGTPERAEAGERAWARWRPPGHRRCSAPTDATLVLPLTEREVLALKGPGLTPRIGTSCLPSPPSCRPPSRPRPTPLGGGGGGVAGQDQRVSLGPVGSGQPRPPHPARVDPSSCVEPALRRGGRRPRANP